LLRLLPLLACKYYRILDRCKHRNLQTVLLTCHYRQRRAVCTRTRDVFGAFWWNAPTRHSSFKDNNFNDLSPSRHRFKRFPAPFGAGRKRNARFLCQCSARAAQDI